MDTNMTLLLIIYAVQVWIGYLIGKHKGRPVLGIVLALLIGFFGWLIVACVPRTYEKQAYDQARIRAILGDKGEN